MARKPPRLRHVKHVFSRGKWYSYFNTGAKDAAGRPAYIRLPDWGTVGFHDSMASALAGRTRRTTSRPYTVADMARDYHASGEYADKSDATRKVYRTYLATVSEVWGAFPVNDLQPGHVRRAIEAEAWSAAKRNMIVAVLGVVYRWGRQAERATVDPTKELGKAAMGEHDPWPEDVLEAALASDDQLVRLAVHLLYFTGQRISDVCALRWGDLRDGTVRIMPSKTRRFRKMLEFPVAVELQAELDRTPKTGLLVLGGITPDALRLKLKAFTKGQGVETVPHGLRKNAVNSLLEHGCTIAEVQSITGQSMQVVEHYAAKVNRRKLGNAAVLKWDLARGTNG